MKLEPDDLLNQVSYGTDSTRQFKVDVRNAESLASEMAAFANSEGRTIYIGVADDGSMPEPDNTGVSLINHRLGSGIKRALSEWPRIDFADDRDECLFVATVHRKTVEELKPEKGQITGHWEV